jgi:CxxC-x17-CxxC domain-containing protein
VAVVLPDGEQRVGRLSDTEQSWPTFPSTPGVSVMPTDKQLNCRDCGQAFLFTVGEQEFFASRGFTNEPSRCPECRAARKAASGGGAYSSGGGSYGGGGRSSGGGYGQREMYSVTCASCGNEARVPFQPRGDKPVYCSDCFSKQRGGGGGGYSSSYR